MDIKVFLTATLERTVTGRDGAMAGVADYTPGVDLAVAEMLITGELQPLGKAV